MALKDWKETKLGDWEHRTKPLIINKSKIYNKWVIDLYNIKSRHTVAQTILTSEKIADKVAKAYMRKN